MVCVFAIKEWKGLGQKRWWGVGVCLCVQMGLCVFTCMCEVKERDSNFEAGLYIEYGVIVWPCLPPRGTICSLSMRHLLV